MPSISPVKFIPRPSEERGHADHDWLKTFHFWDAQHDQFGSLRVINEDRVAPRTGFGTHSHREFEIFSYVVSGELGHKDSMGNTKILKRGDLQLTSAGTDMEHSFYRPSTSLDDEKKDKWARIVAPVDAEGVDYLRLASTGPAPVQSR
ncbi:hypothetical protein HGRIS_014880 [Hohenbuehelia grisea]|uniref:Pirin N-terminal domain-containing protein n=1 Tax=Hohenbuehelia grisea TaxID=104357 RepID=A0ABR3IR10_9AGAR